MGSEPNEIPAPVISEKELEIFRNVSALLEKGGKFLGNHWVPKKGGIFEIKIELDGQIFVLESTRCFPEIFDSQQNKQNQEPAKSY